MSNFHTQYKEYYSRIANSEELKSYGSVYNNRKNMNSAINGQTVLKKITIQSYVSVIMLLIILLLKTIDSDIARKTDVQISKAIGAIDIYKYKDQISIETIEKAQEKIVDKVDLFISSITNSKSILQTINEEFVFPKSNKVVYANKKTTNDYTIFYELPSNMIFSTYGGIVKEVGEDENGKYIVVNHGNGLETVYSMLEQVRVAKGEKIIQDDYIGDCKKSSTDNTYKVGVKVLYMGSSKDISYSLKNIGK